TLTGSGPPRCIVATFTAARSPRRASASVLPPLCGTIPDVAPPHHGRGGPMRRLLLAASLLLATACEAPREVAAPARTGSPRLQYYGQGAGLYALMLHESVPTIRADAVHAMGITGKGMGIAILDSGIDGLYNPDLVYPSHTVQNVKVIFNLSDVVTFGKSAPKPLKQGVDIFAENLPNSETSVGHGTHVAGITAGLGTASG